MQITVAIPCYNGARYVGATIESVLAQTRPADEILVIDDGSTDDSAQIIQSYPVTFVPHVQNKGLSAARNTAIDRARGEILAYIDVDAQADPRWLEELAAGYTGPEIAGVGGAGIEAAGDSLADRWRHRHASQHHGMRPRDHVDFLFGLNMSFRRADLQTVGGFSTTLRTNAEDMDMGFRLNAAGRRLVYRPQARVYHQRTDDLSSLRKTMYNWYFWAYMVRHNNHQRPATLFAGTVRRLLTDPVGDLLQARDPRLAWLTVDLSIVKLRALVAARRQVVGTAKASLP